jgi:hypothetical protein
MFFQKRSIDKEVSIQSSNNVENQEVRALVLLDRIRTGSDDVSTRKNIVEGLKHRHHLLILGIGGDILTLALPEEAGPPSKKECEGGGLLFTSLKSNLICKLIQFLRGRNHKKMESSKRENEKI